MTQQATCFSFSAAENSDKTIISTESPAHQHSLQSLPSSSSFSSNSNDTGALAQDPTTSDRDDLLGCVESNQRLSSDQDEDGNRDQESAVGLRDYPDTEMVSSEIIVGGEGADTETGAVADEDNESQSSGYSTDTCLQVAEQEMHEMQGTMEMVIEEARQCVKQIRFLRRKLLGHSRV